MRIINESQIQSVAVMWEKVMKDSIIPPKPDSLSLINPNLLRPAWFHKEKQENLQDVSVWHSNGIRGGPHVQRAAIITHLAAMYNVLFMIMMSWMSSLCRWVLFLPGLWPTKAGYCFVSAERKDRNEFLCVKLVQCLLKITNLPELHSELYLILY